MYSNDTHYRLCDELKRELMRRLLPPSLARVRVSFSPSDSGENSEDIRAVFSDAGIAGVGFGAKWSAKSFTGDVGVCVFVEKKKPRAAIPRRQRVPLSVNGYPTDVISVGTIRQHSRPVALGASISRMDGGAGSLGCIVQRQKDSALYALSAAHVMAPDGKAKEGDVILSPSASEGGKPLATLTDFEKLKYRGEPNLLDAAIARLRSKRDAIPRMPFVGPVGSSLMHPTVFQSVRKYGAASAHTLGIVTQINTDIRVFSRKRTRIFYKDCFVVIGAGGGFSKGGDSGSIVVDAASLSPIGLLVGGDNEYHSYVIPIDRILARFKATVVV